MSWEVLPNIPLSSTMTTDNNTRYNEIYKQAKTELIAGGIGGSIGIFVGFPVDLIKVKLQSHPTLFKSPYQCLIHSIKEGGYASLYKGCIPPIVTQGLLSSLTFIGESFARDFLEPEARRSGKNASTLNQYLAGCFGGFFQCFVLVPTEVVKCNMQAGTIKNTSGNIFTDTGNCIKNLYKSNGFIGFYRGSSATLLREVPSFGAYFASYKYMKSKFSSYESTDSSGIFSTLVAGGLAGCFSWICVYPTDVIKTNMQVIPQGSTRTSKESMFGTAARLYQTHGLRVFTRGLGTTALRAFPVNAVTWYYYELTVKWLEEK